jgi:NADPH:quinone reductase-like Zn-dependent oxidoreductase
MLRTGDFLKRLEYDRYGGPEVVSLRAFTLPEPQANEVMVQVMAASINPMDWKIRRGEMKMLTGSRFPRGLGTDFAGIVEDVGPKVSRFRRGDPVVGTVSMKRSGAFAPMLITTENFLVNKPSTLSFEHAASLPIAGVTAWQALIKVAGLRRGQRLFINGATGAVGQAAVAIANAIGVHVTGRVGPQSVGLAPSLGLSLALDYTQALPGSLYGSFDVVFDVNGSLHVGDGKRLATRDGMILDIVPSKAKFLCALVSRSRKVIFADVKAENLQHVIDFAVANKLEIPIVQTVRLSEAPLLLASLEKGARLNGKAIISFRAT